MCSPNLIPLIPSVVGAGMNVAQSAMTANDTAKNAAQIAKRQRQEGDQAYAQTMEDRRQQIARQGVAYAKGGVTSDGSPGDVLAGMARDASVAARTAREQGYDAARDTLLDAKQKRRDSLFDSLRSVNGLGKGLLDYANDNTDWFKDDAKND